MQQLKTLGILGGTFDPIHYGHIAAAECARDAFQLDRIILVPSARPPHKDMDGVLDSHHRYEMVQLAAQDNAHFEVSSLELERQGLSYTVETVASCLQIYPGAEIFFILGVDALLLINTWKDLDRLVNLCKFIIVTRPGYYLNQNEDRFREGPASLWEKALNLPIPALFISSSDIRTRVAEGKTIKYLLPPAVEKYIRENNLYRNGDENHD